MIKIFHICKRETYVEKKWLNPVKFFLLLKYEVKIYIVKVKDKRSSGDTV